MQTIAHGCAPPLLVPMLPIVILAVWLAVVTWIVAICRVAATGDARIMPATPARIRYQHGMAPAG
jgi:hypothetical protein